MPEPHLFLAANARGEHVLWWGEGPDDPRCQELDLRLQHGSREAGAAVWGALLASGWVKDYTDWSVLD